MKPICKLSGENGNIFNLLGIARRALKENGLECNIEEMTGRVFASKSYEEALAVISDYVKII